MEPFTVTPNLTPARVPPGVEFSLPLAPSSPSESEEPVGLDDSDPEDDSTASSWLQSMGLHIEDQTGAPDKITLYPPLHSSRSLTPRLSIKHEMRFVESLETRLQQQHPPPQETIGALHVLGDQDRAVTD